MPDELRTIKTPVDPRIKVAIEEEGDPLTPEDIAAIQLQSMQRANPMLTMPDGTKRVACTQCHERPLVVTRLCQECYDERMRIADWKAKLNIVRRGKGKPKLTCPWCGRTDRGWMEGGLDDFCCNSMGAAVWEIYREEGNYQRAADRFDIPGGL
jgi:hypothetical protein